MPLRRIVGIFVTAVHVLGIIPVLAGDKSFSGAQAERNVKDSSGKRSLTIVQDPYCPSEEPIPNSACSVLDTISCRFGPGEVCFSKDASGECVRDLTRTFSPVCRCRHGQWDCVFQSCIPCTPGPAPLPTPGPGGGGSTSSPSLAPGSPTSGPGGGGSTSSPSLAPVSQPTATPVTQAPTTEPEPKIYPIGPGEAASFDCGNTGAYCCASQGTWGGFTSGGDACFSCDNGCAFGFQRVEISGGCEGSPCHVRCDFECSATLLSTPTPSPVPQTPSPVSGQPVIAGVPTVNVPTGPTPRPTRGALNLPTVPVGPPDLVGGGDGSGTNSVTSGSILSLRKGFPFGLVFGFSALLPMAILLN